MLLATLYFEYYALHIIQICIYVCVFIELSILGQLSPSIFLQSTEAFVGQRQDLICTISVSDMDLDAVNLGWFNEEGIITNDSRVNIVELPNDVVILPNFTRTVITTLIQFDPLIEFDEDTYSCYYSVANETEISTSFQLMPLSKFYMHYMCVALLWYVIIASI